jgi:hypothetical protein
MFDGISVMFAANGCLPWSLYNAIQVPGQDLVPCDRHFLLVKWQFASPNAYFEKLLD